MASDASLVRLLIARLLNYGPLSREEQALLEQAVSSEREVPPDTELVLEGTSPSHSTLLLSGFAARYNLKLDGSRQITSLHVAGDFVDLHSLLMKPLDHGIVALTTCQVAMFPHERLTQIYEQNPGLVRLLWLNTLVDGGTHRRWTFCLGSYQAHQHLAHLICELYLRLRQIGRVDDYSFHLPLSQATVGECLAITPVHANRAIQKLRARGVISWERDLITIKDWDGLARSAEFDPTYLRMPKTARFSPS
ncbi:MAG TPA: Crp/Fnr family transcriptional regulator [Devosia sp.]|jgi:CRP-like cAMP-binding protein|uniref:Crp/Fnr family transcriptional regulator n=1 Tax=Devosia sp. TaxID=1871048 RepID=UPI002F923745